jgi:hypothetical protein
MKDWQSACLRWLNSEPPAYFTPPPGSRSIEELRRLSLHVLEDCAPSDWLRQQLAYARTGEQIWQVRCEMYQAIARRHCESEAVRRLDALLPAFEGWLPRDALVPLGDRARGCRQ